jgi:hypothetical protein
MKAKTLDTGIPCAWISIDGGRKKIYDDKFVYLKDGQTFEIELKNPTSTTYLAKIKLNGKHTSQSGIVLRPAEKVVLKRYLDSNHAYVFKTYEVDGNNSAVDAIIAENGLLEVEFYAEQVIVPINNYYYPSYQPYYQPFYTNNVFYGSSIGGSSLTGSNITYSTTTNNASFTNTGSANVNLDSLNCSYTSDVNNALSDDQEETKETGTVEMGAKTDQEFRTVNKMFNSYVSYTTKYQILPESQKPIVAEEIKIYCSDCGKKCKHKDKFCSHCGHSLKE